LLSFIFPQLFLLQAKSFYYKLWKISYLFRTKAEDGYGGGLDKAAKYGHWLLLQQNIRVAAKWLGTLEKLLEQYSEESHSDFHVFISTEPAPGPEEHVVLQGILEDWITITRGAPTRMLANLYAALHSFDQVKARWTFFIHALFTPSSVGGTDGVDD
uniref:Dynein heavy chain region D6 P-loop domain-containing protein n=1 Tax=Gallus gallus TaxID=9031 RepID=A0A8V0XB50_CHICK